MVKFGSRKSSGTRGPSSAVGLVSFNDPRKSLVRLTPEFVLLGAVVLGIVVIALHFI